MSYNTSNPSVLRAVIVTSSKFQPVYYIAALIYLFAAIVFIMCRLVPDDNADNARHPEYLSMDYIYGDYLYDDRFDDAKIFPVAVSDKNEDFYYIDSYGAARTYGGDRLHEGCDIMTPDNLRGRYPVLSVCDGVVENMGWLELGGYRIGIRSGQGVYYYYAHLYSYAYGLKEGDSVSAGDIIGFVGDSGYSKVEGTVGNFDVHLHFGIYVPDNDGGERAINPYPLLKELEKNKRRYSF